MSRGPRLEQIDGGDPTFRVEWEHISIAGVHSRILVPDSELLDSVTAMEIARAEFQKHRDNPSMLRVCVVNERTGFTRDEINRS